MKFIQLSEIYSRISFQIHLCSFKLISIFDDPTSYITECSLEKNNGKTRATPLFFSECSLEKNNGVALVFPFIKNDIDV